MMMNDEILSEEVRKMFGLTKEQFFLLNDLCRNTLIEKYIEIRKKNSENKKIVFDNNLFEREHAKKKLIKILCKK